MPQFLDTTDPDFEAALRRAASAQKREADADVDADGRGDPRRGGGARRRGGDRADRALGPPAADARRPSPSPRPRSTPPSPPSPPTTARRSSSPPTRIRAYHERQVPRTPAGPTPPAPSSAGAGRRSASAGLYVPGGLASYPSSLLMNAIPARVAGVERLVICAPTPTARSTRWCCSPRASPASTPSTASAAPRRSRRSPTAPRRSPPVDKIAGPGNAWVAAAKRRVFGRVGIDMIAGPVRGAGPRRRRQRPRLARPRPARPGRARHRAPSRSSSPTTPASAAASPPRSRRRLATLARRAIAGASWRDYGAVITVRDWDEAIALADRVAPEHLRSDRRRRGAGRARPQRRRDLPRRADPGGDRRLRRRAEPRAADRPLGALLLGPLGARLHEAHHHRPDDAGGARRHRPGGRAAGARPRASRRTASRSSPASTG